MDEGIALEEGDKKQFLEDKKAETLKITEDKIKAFNFWESVEIPEISIKESSESGEMKNHIPQKFELKLPDKTIFKPYKLASPFLQTHKLEELELPEIPEIEVSYSKMLAQPKFWHFNPVAFVEQMRRVFSDLSLVWGTKVSFEFRKKVIEISERLDCNPNYLMTCMALETGGTFNPSITNSLGYTGLIQIGKSAAKSISNRKSIKVTTEDLRKMTAVEQLTYVEYYLEPFKGKLNCLAAFYLAILYPADIKYANNDNHIVFDNSSSNKIRKKAYSQNPLFHNEKPESGKIYVWEIREEIDKLYEKGKKYKN